MKSKAHISLVKLQIVRMILVSMLAAFAISLGSILLFFVACEHIDYEKYTDMIDWYNHSEAGPVIVMSAFLIMFIIHTFWIFILKMNRITRAVSDISDKVHQMTEGDLEVRITDIQNNELGDLAQDINTMAGSIEALFMKEKQWNQERYNMLTNISHDLKTPMMSILGYVDRISNKKYSDDEELTQYCNIIEHKTKDLNTVINQFFQLSKISSGDYKLQMVEIRLLEFSQQVLMVYMPVFEDNSIELYMNIPSDLKINTDISILKHIYENLISNVVKYAAEGHYFEIKASRKEPCTVIEFINHGPRIPLSEIDNIFNKFYREKTSIEKEGSGCGLYIVRLMTGLLNGTITVESNDNETDFILSLE